MILNEDFIKEHGKGRIKKAMQDSRLYPLKEDFNQFTKYDLFISHSFKDKEKIIGLRELFEECGYVVYIDWIDDKNLNRNNVTQETAEIIKSRINASKGLAYIATDNITNSKWCPWELGLADGMKNRACILPVISGISSFKGQEYLGMYPYLDYEKVKYTNRYEFFVNSNIDIQTYITLREWLNGKSI